jgi:hypothetical protein
VENGIYFYVTPTGLNDAIKARQLAEALLKSGFFVEITTANRTYKNCPITRIECISGKNPHLLLTVLVYDEETDTKSFTQVVINQDGKLSATADEE